MKTLTHDDLTEFLERVHDVTVLCHRKFQESDMSAAFRTPTLMPKVLSNRRSGVGDLLPQEAMEASLHELSRARRLMTGTRQEAKISDWYRQGGRLLLCKYADGVFDGASIGKIGTMTTASFVGQSIWKRPGRKSRPKGMPRRLIKSGFAKNVLMISKSVSNG